jgi:hypothetical protein
MSSFLGEVKTDEDDTCHVIGHGELSVFEAARLLLSTDHMNIENLQVEIEDKYRKLVHTIADRQRVEYTLPQIKVTDTTTKTYTYTFTPVTILGGGSYGIVVRYEVPGIQGLQWVVKIERLNTLSGEKTAPPPSKETLLINELTKYQIDCGQIKAWHLGQKQITIQELDPIPDPIETTWADFNLLEPMSGDLSKKNKSGLREVIEKYTKGDKTKDVEAALCIVEEVRKQILCFLEKSGGVAVYTDLKAANVLFTETKEGKLEIKVGDLGSMTTNSDGDNIATFPCFPHTQGIFRLNTKEEKEQCLSWQLGVLLAYLLGIDVSLLDWAHLDVIVRAMKRGDNTLGNKHLQDIAAIQTTMIDKLENIMGPVSARHISQLLSIHPKKRPFLNKSRIGPNVHLQCNFGGAGTV